MKKVLLYSTLLVLFLASCVKEKEPVIPRVETVTFTQESFRVNETESINIARFLEILPAEVGDTVTVTYTSADENIAIVSKMGKVTGVNQGKTTITARAQEKEASCTVYVDEVPIRSFKLPETLPAGYVNKTIELPILELMPADANPKKFKWECDQPAEEVQITYDEKQEKWFFISQIEGKHTFTATPLIGTAEPQTTSIDLSIKAIESIQLEPITLGLAYGQKATLKMTIEPEDPSYPEIQWEVSDPELAELSKEISAGSDSVVLTAANKTGMGKIVVYSIKDPTLKAECEIAIDKGVPMSSFSIPSNLGEHTMGSEVEIPVQNITPQTATSGQLQWTCTSNLSGEQLTPEFKEGKWIVVLNQPGEFTLTAKGGTAPEQTTKVISKVKQINKVTFDPNVVYLSYNESVTIRAMIDPADATYTDFTWQAPRDIYCTCTVDPNDSLVCTITAKAKSTLADGIDLGFHHAAVNEYDQYLHKDIKVHIAQYPAVESFELSETNVEMDINSTYNISATYLQPEGSKPTSLKWETSNPNVVSFNHTGYYTEMQAGSAAGKATITVTAPNGFSRTCEVTVVNIPLKKIELVETFNNVKLYYTTYITGPTAGETRDISLKFQTVPDNASVDIGQLLNVTVQPQTASVYPDGVQWVEGIDKSTGTLRINDQADGLYHMIATIDGKNYHWHFCIFPRTKHITLTNFADVFHYGTLGRSVDMNQVWDKEKYGSVAEVNFIEVKVSEKSKNAALLFENNRAYFGLTPKIKSSSTAIEGATLVYKIAVSTDYGSPVHYGPYKTYFRMSFLGLGGSQVDITETSQCVGSDGLVKTPYADRGKDMQDLRVFYFKNASREVTYYQESVKVNLKPNHARYDKTPIKLYEELGRKINGKFIDCRLEPNM